MLVNVGYSCLVLSLLTASYGAAASVFGGVRHRLEVVESARRAMLLAGPLVSGVVMCLVGLLVGGHYQVEYVSAVVSNGMPFYLRASALWGGQAGSLLLWSWLMAVVASAVAARNWQRDRDLQPWVLAAILITLSFFLGVSLFFENPFTRLWLMADGRVATSVFPPAASLPFIPADGLGLNPLLRHPGMLAHPPLLYLGFVAFVVPYAFAVAVLVTGQSDDHWIRATRRWTLGAWLLLSLGLIVGGRWAYDVLGWGGYWGWDPVEIAGLMPWLSGTAFLHSVRVQERRGMLKQWNMALILLTYALVLLATFFTRSGVLSSVHAFAQSAVGPVFLAFIAVTALASLTLLLRRWDELRSQNRLGSMVSREALFLFNNLFFLALLVVCLWGVIFPLISELLTGTKVTIGPPYYERAGAPLWAALLALMTLAPLSQWGGVSGRKMARAIALPMLLSLGVLVVLVVGGLRQPVALVGYGLSALAIGVTLFEIGRAARFRRQQTGEALLVALWRLIGRNRPRYGGYVAHLGVVTMAIGILGMELFQKETQVTLAQGEQFPLGRYVLAYDSLVQWDSADGRNITVAQVSVFRDGHLAGVVFPRRDYDYRWQQPVTVPGVRSTLADDLYVILVTWQPIVANEATFKAYWNPLVNFIWLGGVVLVLGTVVAAWPERRATASVSAVEMSSVVKRGEGR